MLLVFVIFPGYIITILGIITSSTVNHYKNKKEILLEPVPPSKDSLFSSQSEAVKEK
jgi:hypothetical protein